VELRPPMLDDLGVVATIDWFCREYSNIYKGIKINKRFGIDESNLPDVIKLAIYRVIQEAMNNIAKHAKASLVNVSLVGSASEVVLKISDNGVGFNESESLSGDCFDGRMGIKNMRERARLTGALFAIDSSFSGTVIQVKWHRKSLA